MGRYFGHPKTWGINRKMLGEVLCRSVHIGQKVWDNDKKIFSVVADTENNRNNMLILLTNGSSVELCLEENKTLVYDQILKNIYESVDTMPEKQYIIRYYSPKYGEILLDSKENKYCFSTDKR